MVLTSAPPARAGSGIHPGFAEALAKITLVGVGLVITAPFIIYKKWDQNNYTEGMSYMFGIFSSNIPKANKCTVYLKSGDDYPLEKAQDEGSFYRGYLWFESEADQTFTFDRIECTKETNRGDKKYSYPLNLSFVAQPDTIHYLGKLIIYNEFSKERARIVEDLLPENIKQVYLKDSDFKKLAIEKVLIDDR